MIVLLQMTPFMLLLALLVAPTVEAFILARPITPHLAPSPNLPCALDDSVRSVRLLSTPNPNHDDVVAEDTEETLLKVHLVAVDSTLQDDARAALTRYCQSFPFAAVLPVQPLQYLPTADNNGVEVIFLRKKTDMKSGQDGGVRFFIEEVAAHSKDDETESPTIVLTAKRNAVGQSFPKIVAERLLVTSLVAALTGDEEGQRKYGRAPLDVVRVTSLYHKWMSS